jgi:hypothetical protein
VAFADGIREALLRINPSIGNSATLEDIVREQGWEYAKKFPHIRGMLQRLGTEVGRDMLGADVWVDYAIRNIGLEDRVIITDVRFPNEADAIRAEGGHIWRIWRPGTTAINAHESETAMDDYDVNLVIYNDSTIEQLHRTVNSYWSHFSKYEAI